MSPKRKRTRRVGASPRHQTSRLGEAFGRVEGDDLEVLARLSAVRTARDELELAEARLWVEARALRYSWAALGHASGVTRSAAQQRAANLTRRWSADL